MRLARLLLVGLLLGSGCLFGTRSASADSLPLSQCTPASGVILAVDFGAFGGGQPYTSCNSTPTTGMTLLRQGGFSMASTARNPGPFICRIGNANFNGGQQYPTPSDDPCINTPKASAYWSYWHANQSDASWQYSNVGASDYSPKPGSVDAWAFGAGSPPSFSPDAVRAHYVAPPPAGGGGTSSHPAPPASAPVTAPAHTNPGSSTTRGSSTGSASTPAQSAASSAAASSAAASSAAARSSSARVRATILPDHSSSSTAGAASSSASSSPSPTSSSNATKPGSGNAINFIVGVVVIVAILALAGWQIWLRRRTSRYS